MRSLVFIVAAAVLSLTVDRVHSSLPASKGRVERSFPHYHGPPPPPPTHLLGLPSFAAALARDSAASLVANKQAAAANSAAQVALATAAHKQARIAAVNKAASEAQDRAVAESSLAAEAAKAAHAAEKAYAKAVELSKDLSKLAAESQAAVTDAWQAMQTSKNVASGQETMAYKAQQVANSLSRKQARTLSELDSAQEAVVQAKLAATKAAAAAGSVY